MKMKAVDIAIGIIDVHGPFFQPRSVTATCTEALVPKPARCCL